MIYPSNNCPPELKAFDCFNIAEWITLEYQGERYGWLFYERSGDVARVHAQICYWTHHIQQEWIADFERIKGHLRTLGVATLVVTYANPGDELLYKFLCIAGFSEPVYCAITSMRI